MIVFDIPLETPAKKNSRITLKNGKTIPSAKYREWHNTAGLFVKYSDKPIQEPTVIKLVFTHGDMRKRDSDNGLSSILDLLQDYKVLKDDCWTIIKKIEVENNYNKGNPNCHIEIRLL